jgi:hypothetical protein
MADYSAMGLGRRAIGRDARTLRLADYLTAEIAPPPRAADWTCGITGWGMMMNHALHCCTVVAAAHAVKVWTANAGEAASVADSTALRYYAEWAGYRAGNPATDTGGVALEVLKRWRKHSFDGHRLAAFADADPANLAEIRQGIAWFGGVYAGLALPLTAQYQDVWDVVADGGANAEKGSWGGHCVFVPRYDEKGFTCISWAQLRPMTVAFWSAFCDEAHVLVGEAWLHARGYPAGFDEVKFSADLKAVNGRGTLQAAPAQSAAHASNRVPART